MKKAEDMEKHTAAAVPATIAIVGRPNVGKSTLFNRIVGSRRSIVGNEPGITRDRIYGLTDWNGRELRVIDTGGILPGDKELIPAEIFRQAKVGLEEAGAVILVVDGRSEVAAPDVDLARLLLRSGKPLFLAVNKLDTPKLDATAEDFRRLGIRDLFPISAEHGTGVAELLDALLEKLPAARPLNAYQETAQAAEETRVAIIGRPNVGKSTLLNQLTQSERAIVSPVPGTTRDSVDEVVLRGTHRYRFIDTAGIRRKGKTKLMAEKLSVVMARKHLEAADIALLVVDASQGVTASDATIAGYAHESGRSLIVIVNKWDLLTTNRKDGRPAAEKNIFEQQARRVLKFLNYAPMVFAAAAEGKGIEQVFQVIARVAAERRKRISTSEMNRFLEQVDFQRAGVPASRRVRTYYMTQASVAPPTFILFTDRNIKLHFSYERFLENQIRRKFGFVGTPIWIKTRPKT